MYTQYIHEVYSRVLVLGPIDKIEHVHICAIVLLFTLVLL